MTHPRDNGHGAVRICRRRYVTCWIEGDRDQYEWSVNEAIRLHPKEDIRAGWSYNDEHGSVKEDRTRYNLELGRRDYVRQWPFITVKA